MSSKRTFYRAAWFNASILSGSFLHQHDFCSIFVWLSHFIQGDVHWSTGHNLSNGKPMPVFHIKSTELSFVRFWVIPVTVQCCCLRVADWWLNYQEVRKPDNSNCRFVCTWVIWKCYWVSQPDQWEARVDFVRCLDKLFPSRFTRFRVKQTR